MSQLYDLGCYLAFLCLRFLLRKMGIIKYPLHTVNKKMKRVRICKVFTTGSTWRIAGLVFVKEKVTRRSSKGFFSPPPAPQALQLGTELPAWVGPGGQGEPWPRRQARHLGAALDCQLGQDREGSQSLHPLAAVPSSRPCLQGLPMLEQPDHRCAKLSLTTESARERTPWSPNQYRLELTLCKFLQLS